MTDDRPTIVVLAYHKIGESPGAWESWYYVPQPLFAQQVETLLGGGWRALSAQALLLGLDRPETLPRRGFVITFDDAYRSLGTTALTWLAARGLPAIVFVPTAFVGGLNLFDRDIQPEEPICGWEDLRQLRAGGISIQSHGVSHRAFSELGHCEVVAEVQESKAAIETALGGSVELFSYPYGDSGADRPLTARELERAGYRAAFGYGGGVFRPRAGERYLLPRIAMGPDTDLEAELAAA